MPSCFIDLLPSELLLYVLELSLHADDFAEAASFPRDLQQLDGSPINLRLKTEKHSGVVGRVIDLSRVSRRWRATVVQSPSFWCDFPISASVSTASIELALGRSRELPVSISMTFLEANAVGHSARPSGPREQLRDMLEVLKPHASRWRSLSIDLACNLDVILVLEDFQSLPGAPQLEKLHIVHTSDCCPSNHDTPTAKTYQLFRGSTPLLKDVKLAGAAMFLCERVASLGTMHIMCDFTGPPYVIDELDQMTYLSQSLTRLSLFSDGFFTSGKAPIEMPHVVHLDLESPDADEIVPFLDNTHLPNLQTLALSFIYGDTNTFYAELVSQSSSLNNVLTRIRTLILQPFPLSSKTGMALLRTAAQLETVVCGISEGRRESLLKDLVAVSSRDDGVEPPLVGLTHLFLEKPNLRLLRKFIQNRLETGYQVPRIHLTSDKPAKVAQLREEFDCEITMLTTFFGGGKKFNRKVIEP